MFMDISSELVHSLLPIFMATVLGTSMVTIGMTGSDPGRISSLCDICMSVPDPSTPRIQEIHHLALHVICEIMEIMLFAHGN